jgi:NSS family neurotransmitter:Na+ symporter
MRNEGGDTQPPRLREQWTSNAGFVIATIGSAVGLGNIWRFAYVAGENGGAAFLLVYLVLVLLVGLPLMMAEFVVGRRGAGDAVTAFENAAPRSPLRFVGWIGMVGAFLILSYYGDLSGSLTGALWDAAAHGYGAYFAGFIADPVAPVLWFAAMLLAAMFVVAGGVQRGIERLNGWIMPVLAFIVIALAVFALTLPGAWRGMEFLLSPDWSALMRPRMYLAALGQAFFSLGVGMAVMVTYASYMRRDQRIPASAAWIVGGDTLFAIIAGIAIFPTVFAFGMNPAAGPELAFITLPQIFLQMPGGAMVGPVFFFLLVAAAMTSMVSLLEVPVAFAIHRLGASRRMAAGIIGIAIFLLGVPSALSYGALKGVQIAGLPILDAVDQSVSNFILPLGGLLIAIFVGWSLKRSGTLEDCDLAGSRVGGVWLILIRVVVPAMVAIILLNSLGVW